MADATDQGLLGLLPAKALEKLREIDAEEKRLAATLSDPAIASDHRRAREVSRQRAAIAGSAELFRALNALADEEAQLAAALRGGRP